MLTESGYTCRVLARVNLAVLLCTIPLRAADTRPAWQVLEVGTVGGISVRIEVLSPATLADEDWLAIEFRNSTDNPIQVRHAHYRIECKEFGLVDGQLISSHALASGNVYDLFPKAWETTPVADILIPTGTYRVVQHPSRYSTTLLGLPSRDGVLVKATFHLSLELKDGARLHLPASGVPFEFQWLFPCENGFARMRGRLSELLATPEPKSHQVHGYILGTLLKIPAVSESIPLQSLLSAMNKRTGHFDGRENLVGHLIANYPQSDVVRRYYLDRLTKHDLAACSDLRRAPSLWDRSFVEPLISVYEKNTKSPPFTALAVLAKHHEDWAGRQDVARRLSSVLLRRFGMVLRKKPQELMKNPGDVPDLKTWASFAMQLANTHDREAVALLRPFLDCRVQVLDPKMLSNIFLGVRQPPYRACDVALHGILTVLDGDVEDAYKAAEFPQPSLITHDELTARRDEMIALLKKRLAVRDTTP